ncbi:MAG: C4-dicarboxylate ABC transporter substrate-binding protein, partial [Paracoccaceae bacterium]|nr:C4-dicarboxylate ABC transporter substrate-binding protein [Paracoccaceae bacterium]
MLNIFKVAALAVTASFASASAMAEVNLVSNAAGAGTAGGLTATSLVGYAAERGIANIQLKDGQTGTKYMLALAEGKIDLASGPHVLPFLMGRGAGPYKKLGKE